MPATPPLLPDAAVSADASRLHTGIYGGAAGHSATRTSRNPAVGPQQDLLPEVQPGGSVRRQSASVPMERETPNAMTVSRTVTIANHALRSEAQLPPTPVGYAGRKSIDLGEINASVQPRLRSNSIDPQTMYDELPAHEALLDRGWGTLQGARVKNGRPQIHPWERGVNPDLHVIPAGNPNAVDLKTVLDFDAMKKNGLLYMLAIDDQSRLRVAPETLLDGRDEKTGKERRLGHPALIEGAEDSEHFEGHVGKKQFRICGEIGWDEKKAVVYAMPKSGRYSRHPDRGPDQAEHLRRRLAACGLEVDMRPVQDKE